MADTTDIEKKSLEAHVELCAERYRAIELQLDNVREDIIGVKEIVNDVHAMVHEMSEKRNTQLIGWGVGTIGFLIATVGYLLTHYVLK